MDLRLLDLDGGIVPQQRLRARLTQPIVNLRDWGPRLRLACGMDTFARFERDLARRCTTTADRPEQVTLVGSGDFHHVSLALLRRQPRPFNLLVLDNHPDWMRGIPFLHCGTWLHHAARLARVRRIFHVGGEVDFDNSYRWLAPWPLLQSGKITVFPARRRFRGANWDRVPHQPLRPHPEIPLEAWRLRQLLAPHADELSRYPLYISLDKDVLRAEEAPVNWDSGTMTLSEVQAIVAGFLEHCPALAGMDLVGDWSEVRVQGLFRWILHWTEHPHLDIDAEAATRENEQLSLALLELVRTCEQSR